MLTASCVAVDWGTSSFRLWVADKKGNILNTISGPYGMSLLKPFEYEKVLEEALQKCRNRLFASSDNQWHGWNCAFLSNQ